MISRPVLPLTPPPLRGFPWEQVCRSCAQGCASCGKNASRCLSCEEPLLLHEHQCVRRCPPAHAERDGQCHRCPPACQECSPAGRCTGEAAEPRANTGTRSRRWHVHLVIAILLSFICSSLLKTQKMAKSCKDVLWLRSSLDSSAGFGFSA